MSLTQNIQVSVAGGGVAPYTYQFFSDTDCVSFSNPVGVSNSPAILNTITYENQFCRDTATMSVTIVDGLGCTTSIDIPAVDQCTGLVLNGITRTEDYTFNVTASSDSCSSLSFEWSYNQNVFEEVNVNSSNYSSSLQLRIRDNLGNTPINAVATVTVTDCNNCEVTEQLTFPLCVPQVSNVSIPMDCVVSRGSTTGPTPQSVIVTFPSPTNCTTPIDWNTINFTLPTGISAIPTDNPQEWRFIANSTVTPGTYGGDWSVTNAAGITSNAGSISFVVPQCGTGNTITIIPENINLDCDAITPGVTEIDILIEDNVISTSPIDWSQFEILNLASLTSPSVTLVNDPVTGDHIIRYQVPDPIVTESIIWTVCNDSGQCAQAGVYTLLDCLDPPILVDDEACSVCGAPVTVNVLENDVSGPPLDISSLTIVSQPTLGTISINGNLVTYTPNQSGSFVDTFTYTVRDSFGTISENEGTVTIESICAGDSDTINLCN